MFTQVMTVARGLANLRRSRRSLFPTLTHNMNDVIERYAEAAEPIVVASSDSVTINGYSIGRYFRMLTDFNFLFDELSRWRIGFSIKALWNGDWKNAVEYGRIPTFREYCQHFADKLMACARSAPGYLFWLLKNIKIALMVLIPLLFVCYVLFITQLFTRNIRYKNFDTTAPIHVANRPDAVRAQVPPQQARYDIDAYPAKNRKTAERLIENVIEIDDKLIDPNSIPCLCKMPITQCTCQAPGAYAPMAMSTLRNNRRKLERQLDQLMADLEIPAFAIGDRMRHYVCPNMFYTLLALLGVDAKVTWRVCDVFETGDTRASHEQHISLSNTRFYVIRQTDLRLRIRLLRKVWKHQLDTRRLAWFMVPARDLVVSEDHIRATRRGRLEDDGDKTLRAILQTSMATPINHPHIVANKIDPLRDAYLVTRTIMKGFVPSYWDF